MILLKLVKYIISVPEYQTNIHFFNCGPENSYHISNPVSHILGSWSETFLMSNIKGENCTEFLAVDTGFILKGEIPN